MRPERRLRGVAIVVAAAFAASAHAEPTNPALTMTVQDFAAKWVMQQGDIAGTGFYAAANAALRASPGGGPRIVLMGDSITYHWKPELLPSFDGATWINRGIPGQNSSQMLLRFEDDVAALSPAVVVILAGTNDLRVYAGSHADAASAILARLRSNVTAMADIAAARGIRVVIGAVPPFDAERDGGRRDPETRRAANAWLRTFAQARGHAFADYGGLADAEGCLRRDLTEDGLHPNAGAYALMRPVLADAVKVSGIR
ncbi:GDSL-type esterase/lipase family protein [Sphingosinicella microcystinivorans]|uniref:GDSL-type esterase/lipase family protein n=1 Tax=Sphingosinicella microcystinivorans TaxID=335406 RepID=UPI0022F3EDBC|nr:GDSL-type esterase/lipase family protein [Sphingosinicella microcystinivorans]WBX86405.1 GDSL-type esterase/lipase family protein [Sphingosinicella microcystinivorans]